MLTRLPLVRAKVSSFTTLEWVMLASLGAYFFVYPFAAFLLSFDLMPFGMEWMSSLLLFVLGTACGAWMWLNFGRPGLLLSAAILILGLAVEYLGVRTGFPFGPYRYTGVLAPSIAGGVPVAIGFAWLLIVVSSLFSSKQFFPSGRLPISGLLALSLLSALLAVGLDALLEPVAYHVKGYWVWLSGSNGYYGVPTSNFIAWFLVAFLLCALVAHLLPSPVLMRWGWVPAALYSLNVGMFGLVNLSHGFWIPPLIGLLLLLLFAYRSRRLVAQR
ncbi:MAG: carotenoid biosynthesis protein [Chloroflexota bacterium]|nr:carotenoid biosynthesis protein [Chloroflexota bacterium]